MGESGLGESGLGESGWAPARDSYFDLLER